VLESSIRLVGGGEGNCRVLEEVNDPTNNRRLQIGSIISTSTG
jgi:hypothetical protein